MTPNHRSHPLWPYFVAWTTEQNVPLNQEALKYWDCFIAGVSARGQYLADRNKELEPWLSSTRGV